MLSCNTAEGKHTSQGYLAVLPPILPLQLGRAGLKLGSSCLQGIGAVIQLWQLLISLQYLVHVHSHDVNNLEQFNVYSKLPVVWHTVEHNRSQQTATRGTQRFPVFGICSHKLKENYEIHLWLEAPSAYFKKSVVLAFLQTWEIIPDLLQKELRHINMTVNHIKKNLPASLAFGLHKNHIWQSALMATDDKKNYSL